MMLKLLHLLAPEDAHALTILGLKLGFAPTLQTKADLSINLFGKRIRNPIGLSGGADKEAAALAGWSRMGFGIVEAGTVTIKPRSGNAQPRMWRLPQQQSVVNWLGLPGDGYQTFVNNLAAFQNHPARKDLCVGASIASPDGVLEEFTTLAKAVQPYVDYITLNASCPNVAHGSDALVVDQIKAAKAGAGSIPVLVKLGPTNDKAALALIVNAALAAGADGFVATNTVPFAARALLQNTNFAWPKNAGNEVGGFSGGQLLEISTWMVREIRALIPPTMPLIGVGGVQSGADAKRLLDSGANAIQLYTGLIYKGPALVDDIAQTLANNQANKG